MRILFYAYAWFFRKVCYIVGRMRRQGIRIRQLKTSFLILLLVFAGFVSPITMSKKMKKPDKVGDYSVDTTLDRLLATGIGKLDGENNGVEDSTVPDDLTVPGDSDLPDIAEEKPNLIIKAINPGYRVNGVSEVGELIELWNVSGGSLELGGYKLRYTNGSGNATFLVEFPEGAILNGENLLLRYAKSPEHELADMVYTSSLAMSAGPLEIIYKDQVIDKICWTGKTDCEKSFKSGTRTTLVRDLEKNSFEHLEEYNPEFEPDASRLYLPPDPQPEQTEDLQGSAATPQCYKLEFTEVYSYYGKAKAEQFIELHNPAEQDVIVNNCKLKYKKKTYELSGTVRAGGYFVYYPEGKFSLTKNPTTSNSVELLDVDGKIVDELVYLHGQKKSTSYAKFYDAMGAENWAQTYARTPGSANTYQEFQTCPVGKVINPETGNCVKAENIASASTECPAGKVRNPLTGRCRKPVGIASKECKEGYERNPETNRCRKIKKENSGAEYAVIPSTATSSNNFVALWVIIAIIILGVVYVVWQFRREILRTFRKARQRVQNVGKNFFTRASRRDRHK